MVSSSKIFPMVANDVQPSSALVFWETEVETFPGKEKQLLFENN